MTDYGSGLLGNFASMGHAITGALPWGQAKVGVIGDSITARGWSKLAAKAVAAGVSISVNYWSGRPFAGPGGAAEWLMQQEEMPEKLLIACGANDIFDPPAFTAALASFLAWMEVYHPETKIFWVDVQVRRTSVPVATQWADQMNSAWINQTIHEASAFFTVIHWSNFLIGANKNRPAYYLEDGVHPTTVVTNGYGPGTESWAAVIWAAIAPYIDPPAAR